MIDIKDLRARPEAYRQAMTARGEAPELIDSILDVDTRRRVLETEVGQMRANFKEINRLEGHIRILDKQIAETDKRIAEIEAEQWEILRPLLEADIKFGS